MDRNKNGGGILIYVREDIPSKELTTHFFPDDIEGIFIEINLRKTKWLIFGSYHPPSQSDSYYFNCLGNALDTYNKYYDRFLLIGDFNAEDSETCLSEFLYQYEAKNIVKDKTCFKNPENASCIDLFLTNSPSSFQNTMAISTGLSDFHKMILTVCKCTFVKAAPKVIRYRDYKKFNEEHFRTELKNSLRSTEIFEYTPFENIFLSVLEKHAPLKEKTVRANHAPYMTKVLRKAIMRRSAPENKYYKVSSAENRITLIDDNKNIVSDDQNVSETLNNFFKSAVDSLEIDENKFLLENTDDLINPIDIYSFKEI